VNWSGFYLGGAIGYGNANHELSVFDYWKDYCDSGFYVGGAKDDPAVLKSGDDQKDESDPQTDINRFFEFGGDNLEGCTPPTTNADLPGGGFLGNYAPIGIEPGDSREIAHLDGLNSTGIVGDIRAGYDQQLSNRFLVGIFGTYGFSNMDADGSAAGVGSFKLERGDDWSVGARAGVLVNDSTLLYALAAYTQTEYDLSLTDGAATLSKTTTFDGITVGAGIELAVANNVFLGIEGTHTFYGEETIFDDYDAVTNVGTSVDDDLSETKILGTLKIKINSF